MNIFEGKCSVEDTAVEAANVKWSAVHRGYYNDPYISKFVPNKQLKLAHQNLGSYFRVKFIHDGAVKFHDIYGDQSQVVVLGCGYDTLFWILRDKSIFFKRWYDIDKASVISKKLEVINSDDIFNPMEGYYTNVINFEESDNFIQSLENFDISLPTLFIDEFSMIYMKKRSVHKMMKSIAHLKNSCFISYGMTLPNDDFGELVKDTFNIVGIPLKSYDETDTIEKSISSLLKFGFPYANAIDSDQGIRKTLDAEDKVRISHLDFFDDQNHLIYTMKHYLSRVSGCEEFVKIIP